MLKGQLSISFVMKVALGITLMITLAYATISLEDTMKKESQKQTIISVSEYAGKQILSMAQYLKPGESINQTIRLPMSRDYNSGQYWIELEDINGVAYVSVTSAKWPDMTSRQPLFLNTTMLDIDTTPVYPPGMCPKLSRNNTHYIIGLGC